MIKTAPNRQQGETDAITQCFPAEQVARPKGLALVIHGLNLKPRKMSPIINALTKAGIEALNVSLRGHGENYTPRPEMDHARARAESFKEVDYELWANEVQAAQQAMETKRARLGVPTFLVGFSLGALLGVDLWAANADIRFDRALLFAPALHLRAPYRLVRMLYPWPGLVLPSLGRQEYLANRGVPIIAYRALLETMRHFRDHVGPRVDLPTLIFIDRGDEFISYKKVKRFIDENRLHKWKIGSVKKDADAKVNLKHLIIDETGLGRQMWRETMGKGIRHLLNPPEAT